MNYLKTKCRHFIGLGKQPFAIFLIYYHCLHQTSFLVWLLPSSFPTCHHGITEEIVGISNHISNMVQQQGFVILVCVKTIISKKIIVCVRIVKECEVESHQ